jgi:hypothetical protein
MAIRRNRLWGLILKAILALNSSTCVLAAGTNDVIDKLHRMTAWPELINSMQHFRWKETKDLEVLISFTEALVETQQSLSPYLEKFALPLDIKRLLQAYHELYSGNFKTAKTSFELLANEAGSKELGLLGLLDYGVAMGNAKIIGETIALVRRQKDLVYLHSQLPDYEIVFATIADDLITVNELIAKHRLEPVKYSLFSIRDMLDKGKISEAARMIGRYRKKYGYDHNIALLDTERVLLSSDTKTMLKTLDGLLRVHPRYWQLSRQKFFALMAEKRDREARAVFEELQNRHPKKLDIVADNLVYFGSELVKSGKIYQLFEQEKGNFDDAPGYLYAKASVLFFDMNRREEGKALLSKAQEFSPASLDMFLLQERIARTEGRLKDAQDWQAKYRNARSVRPSVATEK